MVAHVLEQVDQQFVLVRMDGLINIVILVQVEVLLSVANALSIRATTILAKMVVDVLEQVEQQFVLVWLDGLELIALLHHKEFCTWIVVIQIPLCRTPLDRTVTLEMLTMINSHQRLFPLAV